jgi:hypothetical protein
MKAWDDRGRTVRLKASWLRSKVDQSLPPPLKIGPEQIKRADFFERRIAAELIISLVFILGGCIFMWRFVNAPAHLLLMLILGFGLLLTVLWRAAARMDLVSGIHYMLAKPQCPGCDHLLTGVPPQQDGCTICPECGAAWRLPRQGP